MLPLLVTVTLCSATSARAGGGPENVLLVVNTDSSDSLAVANEYIHLRDVPAGNVIYLDGIPDAHTLTVADLRALILRPLHEAISQRGLDGQTDYVLYSAGFPYAVDVREDMAGRQFPKVITQPASLTGVTYFSPMALAEDLGYLALDANWYARRLKQERPPEQWTDTERARQVQLQALLSEYQKARKEATEAKTPLAEEARGLLDDALALLQSLAADHPQNPELLYNQACVLALQGKPEEAMSSLAAAHEAGWWNGSMTEADRDLASLRARDDYKALLAKMNAVILETQPPQPFSSQTTWARGGEPTEGEGRRYVLSAMLAHTGGAANTLEEALACLRRSAAADGSRPTGTVYYMVSGDRARTGPRQWAFRSAAEALGKLGVRSEALPGVLPQEKADVAGLAIGTASFTWADSGSNILPGAFCDHLTSFGGVMKGTKQTLLSEFLRHGAAGACGTVTEPYNTPAKFPSPFLHVFYASGCSLAEAFYQSVPGPYQQFLVGDALCQPWATPPEVSVRGIQPGQVVSGRRRMHPTASGPLPVTRYELFVDGRRVQVCAPAGALVLEASNLAMGYHEARVVAIAGPLETQGRAIIPFRVGKRTVQADGWPTEPVTDGEPLCLTLSLKGAERLAVLHSGREVGVVEGESGEVEVTAEVLGAGRVKLQPVAYLRDGSEVRGEPRTVLVQTQAE